MKRISIVDDLKELKPKKALNKSFLKVKPNRAEIYKEGIHAMEIPQSLLKCRG